MHDQGAPYTEAALQTQPLGTQALGSPRHLQRPGCARPGQTGSWGCALTCHTTTELFTSERLNRGQPGTSSRSPAFAQQTEQSRKVALSKRVSSLAHRFCSRPHDVEQPLPAFFSCVRKVTPVGRHVSQVKGLLRLSSRGMPCPWSKLAIYAL